MKPTEDTIALAAFLLGADEWRYADEIRHAIKRLGFELPSSQWVVARLKGMTEESAPRFESQLRYPVTVYRPTAYASNGLANEWRGFQRAVLFS